MVGVADSISKRKGCVGLIFSIISIIIAIKWFLGVVAGFLKFLMIFMVVCMVFMGVITLFLVAAWLHRTMRSDAQHDESARSTDAPAQREPGSPSS